MKYHLVVQTEYERGWGSKDFVATEYDNESAAKDKVAELNAENNLPTTPDYYIHARYVYEMTDDTFEKINHS